MEMRVWVDGNQRVVCGVKLTTTCQEIVFALAHATQQAGRFTMIEKWRNNERLLSPYEQPLVTLQRWGDHMNEVEFILRKTSTSIPSQQPSNQPPAVPAKPRLIGPIPPVASMPSTQQPQLRPINNSQMNFYSANQISFNMYSPANGLRPRQPPRYLDYMEAIANRNALAQPNVPNHHPPASFTPQNHRAQSNIFQQAPQSTSNNVDSVTEMGQSMLKVIEEQKKVLINQKNELDRLDNDNDFWEEQNSSEQTELVDRIDSEIRQLEDLWKENQAQIRKLENQGFEKELERLKSEQLRMESEIEKQKVRLTRCEKDVNLCKSKIDQLEAELEEEQSVSI